MDKHKLLEELQREIRDRKRLGQPTGLLSEQEAELRRQLRSPPPPPLPRRQLTPEQEATMQRWHKEHKRK